jgi:hypothetical protein
MFGMFGTAPVDDPQLGELRRKRGMWRGTIVLGAARVPLVLSGSHKAPDSSALEIARTISASYDGWRPTIAQEMLAHYSPYAQAVEAGEAEPPPDGLPSIDTAAEVWPYTSLEYVLVAPLDGQLTVEIGYRVDWDEEHTLGARFRAGRLVELSGSVLAP